MAELRCREGVADRALEFAVLTATRTGAVIGATWTEIDLDAHVWTIMPDRLGAKITDEKPAPRHVPLSARVIEILRSLPREKGDP
jgi:integrase